MEVLVLEMGKTSRRKYLGRNLEFPFRYVTCPEGENEVRASIYILGYWYVEGV